MHKLTRFLVTFSVFFVVAAAAPGALPMPQPRPIIGIMTQPVDDNGDGYVAKINADYVKQIESSGARVVPVPHTASPDVLDTIFLGINGLLYPGGADILDRTQYYNASKYLFDKAVVANKAGDHFPLWGTCLGFQFLMVEAASGDVSVLSKVTAENITMPLHLTREGHSSRLFSAFPSEALAMINRGEWLMEQYHHFGVTPATFHERNLSSVYSILATNRDRDGVAFISAVEARGLPFYGVQFHPERSLFEWTPAEDVAHSADAVFVAQQFGNLLAREARRSRHRFPSQAREDRALIYRWAKDVHYTQPEDPATNQVYLFKEAPLREMGLGWLRAGSYTHLLI